MTCDRSFLAKLRRLTVPICGESEGSSPLGADLAPHTCIRSVRLDPDHDAVMRIGVGLRPTGLMGWMAPSRHLCAKVGLWTTPTDGSHP